MTDTLRIKRRAAPGAVGAPPSLANAELAYNENDHTLYIGEGTGGAGGTATSIVAIGGAGMASNALPVMNGTAASGTAPLLSRADHVHPSDTSRAPLVSPIFTGDPQAPTPAPGDSDTSIATTAFVTAAVAAATAGVSSFNGRTGAVTLLLADVTGAGGAPIASPSLTGVPLAPTAGAGTSTTQIATTEFVQAAVGNMAQGLDPKDSVRAATTLPITLSGTQTIDGVALTAGQRVLVKNQSPQSENGIYLVNAGAWTRSADTNTWGELVSAFTFVEEGTTNADSGWVCTVDQGGTLGTTAVTWAQFSGAGQISAGAGLVKTGNQLDVLGTTNRIFVDADTVDISPNYVGQTSITTLGTVTTGVWSATTIAVNKGGTGATSLTGYVKGNGTSPFTASATIPNTDITGLGTMALQNANAVAITGGTIDGITFDGGTF